MRNKIWILLGGSLLTIIVAVLLVVPAVRESQTQDEAVYVISGLSYWKTRDFRLNPEHPPFIKELFALPLLTTGVLFDPKQPDWEGASQWDVSPDVLYTNVLPGRQILAYARSVNIIITLLFILLCAVLSWKVFGLGGASITAIFLAFEPNVLANGHLATTDIGYALSMLAAITMFGLWLEKPTTVRALFVAVLCSLSILTRFNALLLLLLLPLLYVLSPNVRTTKKQLWQLVLFFLVLTPFLIWLSYGFEVRTLDRTQDGLARNALSTAPALLHFFERTPLPAMSFISGLFFQVDHNRYGQWGYLFGHVSHFGWWFYFAAAMMVKMTLGSLIAALLGGVAAFRRKQKKVFSEKFLFISLLVIIIGTFPSRLPLGVRYVLPAIALLLVLAGGLTRWMKGKTYRTAIVVGLMVWHVVSVVRIFPHWLPYANEAFGGPTKLEQSLIDSNLDWGQDITLVADYMKQHGIEDYYFKSFSTAPARAYGLYERDIPTDADIEAQPFRGVVAIGKSALYYPGEQFEWLKRIQPTTVLGYSTNIYDLR